jgi:hypothetical protein
MVKMYKLRKLEGKKLREFFFPLVLKRLLNKIFPQQFVYLKLWLIFVCNDDEIIFSIFSCSLIIELHFLVNFAMCFGAYQFPKLPINGK